MANFYRRSVVLTLSFLCSSILLFAQTPSERADITRNYDQAKLKEISKRISVERKSKKDYADSEAKRYGWAKRYSFNNGRGEAELMMMGPTGIPIYCQTFNVDAATSTRTDHLNSGGSLGLNLDGQGMTAYVWDGGAVREGHQEFDGPGGTNRASQNDGASSLSDHATHVTGTMIAAGIQPDAKGMATFAQALNYDWNNDIAEMANEAANGMLVSNHSYGYGWRNNQGQVQLPAYFGGGYIAESRDVDELMYNAPYYLMFSSAGNDGEDNTANSDPLDGFSNYDKLTAYSCAKNNMVVAATQDVTTNPDGTISGSVNITSFSSEGPTDDYRIKPDIAGNGAGLFSPLSSSNSAYGTFSGTSMSSPNVAGSALLLQQHYNNVNGNFMRAATLKGLILHTADDAGSTGPDAIYGWGLMNAKAAVETINENGNTAIIDELSLNNGGSYQITVSASGGPLMASISWTDPEGIANTGTINLSTPALVNDLDIRVTQGGSTNLPWALTGVTTNAQQDNIVDPYERVDINNASGSYTITVTHKGTLSSAQDFSLIVTGVTGCDLAAPNNLTASNIGDNSFDLSWNSVSGASGYTVNIGGNSTNISGTSYSATGLTAGTSYNVSVSANCPDGGSGTPSTSTITTTGTAPISCNGTISSYPYTESFESNDGWTQLGGDDGDWLRDAGGTPSNNTGPSNGADGSWYMFLEASTNGSPGQIGNNATAILESPCFDLSGANTATFSFQNHMYGTDVGSLTIQATNDDQTWSDVWTQSGNQGNQWNTVDVNMDAFAGGTVKMRIVGTTGNGWSSDIAIDALAMSASNVSPDTEAPSIPAGLNASNIGVTSFDVSWNASTDNIGVTGYNVFLDGNSQGTTTNTSFSFSGLSESTSYTVTVSAFDAAGNTSALSSELNVSTNAAPDTDPPSVPTGLTSSNIGDNSFDISWTASTDNVGVTGYSVFLNGNNQGTTANTSFSLSGLTAGTTYSVTVSASDAAGNTSAQSPALNVSTTGSTPISCNGTVSLFPYSESFEFNDGWDQLSGDDGDWLRDAGGTPSNNTGPSSGANGSWYMFLEASTNGSTGQIGNNATAILESPCFDLGSFNTATFTFQNHMFGTDVGFLTLQASTDGQNWSDLWTQSGDQGNQWNTVEVNLDIYTGGIVKLRMIGTTGNGWSSDIAIDDLSLSADNAIPDTESPTVPSGLVSSNVSSNAFDVSWIPSSDNVGVAGYTVFLDGISQGTTANTSFSFTGLNASTTYSITVNAFDAAGNTSASSSTLDVTTSAGSGSTVISASFFETGWDDWIDGGSDAIRSSDIGWAFEGNFAAQIRDNTNSSVITTIPFNLTGYSSIEVEFFFIPRSMENGEDFWLQYNDGSGFSTIASWVIDGSNISNNSFYTTTVTLNSNDFNFVDGARFRFRNDASVNNDRVYIDAITITGILGSTNSTSMRFAPMGISSFLQDVDSHVDDLFNEELYLNLYPNPARQVLNIVVPRKVSEIQVFTMTGKLVIRERNNLGQIDISQLADGMYVLGVRTEEGEVIRKKFLKQ